MPHCIICKSDNECQLLKGRFFCAECRNDLAACEIDSKKFNAMMEYLKVARAKNETRIAEEQLNGGLTQIEVSLMENIIRRINDAKRS